MPIALSCSCGKKFAAADDARGKGAKCPQCGAVMRVPGEPAASAPIPTRLVKCACGKLLRVKGQPAGGVNCPACGQPVDMNAVVQRPAGAPAAAKPKGPPCPTCGRPVEAGAGVCLECGTNVSTGQQVQALDPATIQARKKRRSLIVAAVVLAVAAGVCAWVFLK